MVLWDYVPSAHELGYFRNFPVVQGDLAAGASSHPLLFTWLNSRITRTAPAWHELLPIGIYPSRIHTFNMTANTMSVPPASFLGSFLHLRRLISGTDPGRIPHFTFATRESGRIVSLQFVTPRLSTGRVRCTLSHNPLVLLLIDDEGQLCQSHRHSKPHPMLPTHHRTLPSCRCIRHFMDRVQHEIPNRLADRQREDQSDRIGRFSNLDQSQRSSHCVPQIEGSRYWGSILRGLDLGHIPTASELETPTRFTEH